LALSNLHYFGIEPELAALGFGGPLSVVGGEPGIADVSRFGNIDRPRDVLVGDWPGRVFQEFGRANFGLARGIFSHPLRVSSS
jgi:hypothetical protein